jgi:adenine deaminase
MSLAVETSSVSGGGIVLTNADPSSKACASVAGLMSDRDGAWVDAKLARIHETAHDVLGVSLDVEPMMTLCFMSLPVIPSLKLTDMGLFDVDAFSFCSVDA